MGKESKQPLTPAGCRVSGFDVIDAVGLHLGSVAECLFNSEGRPVFLRVVIGHEGGRGPMMLVPVHYVTLVDTDRCKIQVRAMRRRTATEFCLPDIESTDADLVSRLAAGYPPARNSVAVALRGF